MYETPTPRTHLWTISWLGFWQAKQKKSQNNENKTKQDLTSNGAVYTSI